MKNTIWVMVVILIVLHQDNWFWEDDRLVFGFMPVGLLYHACISIAASLTWLLAVAIAWPKELVTLDHSPADDGANS